MLRMIKATGLLTVLLAVTPLSFAQHVGTGNSPSDCAAIADRQSRGQGSTMGGVGRGAAGGAIFGAIVGDSSKSAGRGALLGGIIGGARKSSQKENTYQQVYDDCMRRR